MIDSLEIGLIEDAEHDVVAFRRAFARIGTMRHWPDGESFRRATQNDPLLLGTLDLLLVDLNLPGVDGVEIARAIRATPGAEATAIVILTGSHAEHDILRALDADVTEYEIKPDDTRGLHALVTRCAELVRSR